MPRLPSPIVTTTLLLCAAPLVSACVAKTAFDVATAPVKVASRGVDLATTSQSEADEKRGREIRRREEELADLRKDYDKLEQDCLDGDDDACRKAVEVRAEIEALLPTIPVEPES